MSATPIRRPSPALSSVGPASEADTIGDGAREDVRVWLQLVKAVLPMEREVNRLFQQEFGQSLPRFDVLSQLDRARAGNLASDPPNSLPNNLSGGLPVGLLAERLIASAGNITRLVQRMADEGLVARTTADDDKRQQIVAITARGDEVYRAMATRHAAWAVDRLDGLTGAEKATLRSLLEKLRRRTPAADPEDDAPESPGPKG